MSPFSDLLDWIRFNWGLLEKHELWATGTTGILIKKELGLEINVPQSGPLGGDQQVGAKITEGQLDFLIFFRTRLNHSLTTLTSKPC